VSEEERKGLPSGIAGPGSGAAATWSHVAAAQRADPQSGQRSKRSFQAGRCLSSERTGAAEVERQDPGGRGAGAGWGYSHRWAFVAGVIYEGTGKRVLTHYSPRIYNLICWRKFVI